jgi:hypothetical protein
LINNYYTGSLALRHAKALSPTIHGLGLGFFTKGLPTAARWPSTETIIIGVPTGLGMGYGSVQIGLAIDNWLKNR